MTWWESTQSGGVEAKRSAQCTCTTAGVLQFTCDLTRLQQLNSILISLQILPHFLQWIDVETLDVFPKTLPTFNGQTMPNHTNLWHTYSYVNKHAMFRTKRGERPLTQWPCSDLVCNISQHKNREHFFSTHWHLKVFCCCWQKGLVYSFPADWWRRLINLGTSFWTDRTSPSVSRPRAEGRTKAEQCMRSSYPTRASQNVLQSKPLHFGHLFSLKNDAWMRRLQKATILLAVEFLNWNVGWTEMSPELQA